MTSKGDIMRIKVILPILLFLILLPFHARAIDQPTIEQMLFLLNQPEWNQWGEGVFDDITLYEGLQAIYAQAVNEGDDALLQRAIWAMGETGLAVFVPTLVGALAIHPISACYALGKIPSEDSVDALIDMLDDDDEYVRDAAAWGLGNIKYNEPLKKAQERALNALKARAKVEPEEWVKETISGAIAMIETGIATSPAFQKPEE